MNVHSIEVYNKKVAYQDEGKGEVFLLIHGFCGSSPIGMKSFLGFLKRIEY